MTTNIVQIFVFLRDILTNLGIIETFTKQNDFCNHARIWDNHGYWSEHTFQVIWKLSTASIT